MLIGESEWTPCLVLPRDKSKRKSYHQCEAFNLHSLRKTLRQWAYKMRNLFLFRCNLVDTSFVIDVWHVILAGPGLPRSGLFCLWFGRYSQREMCLVTDKCTFLTGMTPSLAFGVVFRTRHNGLCGLIIPVKFWWIVVENGTFLSILTISFLHLIFVEFLALVSNRSQKAECHFSKTQLIGCNIDVFSAIYNSSQNTWLRMINSDVDFYFLFQLKMRGKTGGVVILRLCCLVEFYLFFHVTVPIRDKLEPEIKEMFYLSFHNVVYWNFWNFPTLRCGKVSRIDVKYTNNSSSESSELWYKTPLRGAIHGN